MRDKNLHKRIICRILGWSDLDYQLLQYNAGLEYLNINFAIEQRIEQISRTQSWWRWWEQQWRIRDAQFIHRLRIGDNQPFQKALKQDYEDLYLLEHDPADLQVYPSRVVKQLIEQEAAGKLKIKYLNHGNTTNTGAGQERQPRKDQAVPGTGSRS